MTAPTKAMKVSIPHRLTREEAARRLRTGISDFRTQYASKLALVLGDRVLTSRGRSSCSSFIAASISRSTVHHHLAKGVRSTRETMALPRS